jgi:hypothetical protein
MNEEQRFEKWFEQCAHPLRYQDRAAASIVWSACAELTERRITKKMNDRFEEIERTMYLRGDALEFANYLADQAEVLIAALANEDQSRIDWDESGAGTPEFERWGRATETRIEHVRALTSRIYEFRKRIPPQPFDTHQSEKCMAHAPASAANTAMQVAGPSTNVPNRFYRTKVNAA